MKSRTKKKYHPRPARAPTLIARAISPSVETSEKTALFGLTQPWASEAQFNILAECCDMLMVGGEIKKHEEAVRVAEFGAIALRNMRDRFFETKRMGATGDELSALHLMVDYAQDWWNRQSGETFRAAYVEVDARRKAAVEREAMPLKEAA